MSKASKNIKKQRALNGMTQEELAAKIHVTRQTVSSWETDRTQPDLTVLQSLAEVFGTEVEELIYGKRIKKTEMDCSISVFFVRIKVFPLRPSIRG